MVGLLGFVLTFVRLWTGSVVSSAMVHYFYNGGVTVLTAVIIMISNPPYFDYHLSSSLYDFETKERLLKESMFIQPQMAEVYYELAQLYFDEHKKTEDALEYIDKALSFNGESFRFLELKLALLKAAERSTEAEKLENDIKDLYPDRDIEDLSPLKVLK
jgi:tetratricopeptide (TPR) repeat protein